MTIQESSVLWKETTYPRLCTKVQKKSEIWTITPEIRFAKPILLPLKVRGVTSSSNTLLLKNEVP